MKIKKCLISLLAVLTVGCCTTGMTSCDFIEGIISNQKETNIPSEGLAYTLSEDGTYYIVTNIGECEDKKIVIPDTYEGLLVASIGDSAFEDCDSLAEIVIPDSVTSIGEDAFYKCRSLTSVTIGNSVTSIGDYAFYECSSLTEIVIPDSVTSIGDYAFAECSSLTEIVIPDSVTSISDYAFGFCSSLTEIIIPDSVTSIGNEAFAGCSSLTEIVIPDSVTSIGDYAFGRCRSLTEITVDEDNANYSSLDGNLYNKDQTELIQYAMGKTATSFEIPDSVTSIGDYVFENCSSLTEVVIPDSVTSIGDYAFGLCSSLTEVVIPDSVTSIGDYAFAGCSSLTEIVIPGSVTSIGDYAFSNCSSLTSVTIGNGVTSIGDYAFGLCYSLTEIIIPDSVTSIGRDAFYYCRSLTSVTIPDSVTSIGDWAFYDCYSLTNVVIGNSVTSIGSWAFYDCYSLTEITVDEDNANYSSLNGNLYNKDQTEVIQYAIGKTATLFEIPDGVTSIGDWAFYDCISLTEIVIPDSVTSIGNYAFYGTGYYNDGNNWEDGVLYIGKYLIDAKDDIAGKYTIKDGTVCIASAGTRDGDTISSRNAFAFCDDLTEIVIPDSVTSIGAGAFYRCRSLTSIQFEGTVEQWNAIEKGYDWNYIVPATEVVCSDGRVALN